jgi:pimeloyl-ACP methyl ester carboxylesterase
MGRPLMLILHGFPNLAYSWRKVMPALATAGYYAVAPDCRGFGRTTGWDNSWDAHPFHFSCSIWCATRSRFSLY